MEQSLSLGSPLNDHHQQTNDALPLMQLSTWPSNSDVAKDVSVRSPGRRSKAHIDDERFPAKNIELFPSTLPLLKLGLEQEPKNASKPSIKHDFSPARLFSTWTKEFLSWLLALAFFGALVGVLAAFNGRSVPHWKFGITLGALASLFATLAGYTLMLPVIAALGQLKWMWFERARPILDFEILEKAGQGPEGSVLLLCKGKGGFTASIGAILIVLQLAIGPFVQQIIQTKDISIRTAAASVPIAINYTKSTDDAVDINLSLKAAIMNAALDINAPSTDFDVSPICSTGNCTWPPYQSLGFCSTCTEITSQLTAGLIQNGNVTEEGYNWTLPNGVFLVVENFRSSEGLISMTMNNTIATPQLESLITSQNQSLTSLLDVFIIVGNSNYTENAQVGPFAAECLLQICIQFYNAQESNAIFRETIQNNPDILSTELGSSYPYASGSFSYDYSAAGDLQIYLADTFNGAVSQYDSLSGGPVFTEPVEQAMFEALNNSSPHTLTSVFSNIAKSMTRNLRTPSITIPSTSLSTTSQVIGEAASLTTVILIQWYWICLPAFLIAAVLVFLLAVIWQTESRNIPHLKNSSLATLFYGLGDEVQREHRGIGSRMEIEKAAAKLRVRFRNDTEGWSLEKS